MKKISKISSMAAGVLLLMGASSCTEDYLDVDYGDILPGDYMTSNDAEAENGLTGCYRMMLPSSLAGEWGLKPNLFFGCHPTLDTQATGWDVDWCHQNWGPDSEAIGQAWKHVYHAISRCNDFLAEIEKSDNISADAKAKMTAEGKALRGFFYHWLAQAFGRVPLLGTGENFLTDPVKAKAATDAEMWDFVIKDLKEAADGLDWQPRNGEYGRCTKGMALTYLADAYMWKAVRCNDASYYTEAKKIYEEIINSGTYELQHSFSTLFEPTTTYWNKETIWAEILDERDSYNNGDYGSFMHMKWFTGCKQTGGWGTLFLSWEWYLCYEKGDKRRDASACVGPVEKLKTDFPDAVSDYCYGQNPFVFDTIPGNGSYASHYQYKEESGWAPSVWTLKYWREPLSWQANQPHVPIYYMRYANVLLAYAECCFRTGDEAKGWEMINQVRNRAWGNLEADCQDALYATYYATKYDQAADKPSWGGHAAASARAKEWIEQNGYPIPFNRTPVTVPDAKTYYTQYKADKGFKSDVWVVALGTEYRKEFNAEWCLAPALIRMGFIEDHINTNYPKNMNPNGDADNWHTQRDFDFDVNKMLMPIPADEILRNPACEQNAPYKQ